MRDYYRRTLIDRWDDLLELSPNAQRVYFYAFAGPTSTAYGLSLIHAGRARRDLGITRVELQGALVELAQSGCVQFDEVKSSRFVLCDLDLAATIAPKDPNNKIAAAKRCAHVPPCDTQRHWLQSMGIGAQLPESTGNRGASPRQALGKPSPSKKKNKKENENENQRSSFVDKVAEVCALYRDICEQAGLQGHRWTSSGLPKGKALRRLVEGSVKRGDVGDYKAFFESVTQSDFLMGRTGTWRASLDWLMRAGNEEKVLDGKYSNSDSDSDNKQAKLEKFDGWLNDQGMYG